MRAEYLQWIVAGWFIVTVVACGSGGDSDGQHQVNAASVCLGQSGLVECPKGKVSPRHSSVRDNNIITFTVTPEPGHVTEISTTCKVGTQLSGLRSHSYYTSDGTKIVEEVGELTGNTFSTGAVTSDCAEGNMTGVADPRNAAITGKIDRYPSPEPCPSNTWLFSAFGDKTISASGKWSKTRLTSGAFEGRRIAALDGPNVQYFYPPWASAGAYVTIVGKKLNMDLVNDSLSLGFGGTVLVPEASSEFTILLKLPGGPGDSAQFHLTTVEGTALSPLPLNTGVTNPDTGYTQLISLADSNPRPDGVVFSLNNRRAFIANRGTESVSMINTDLSQ